MRHRSCRASDSSPLGDPGDLEHWQRQQQQQQLEEREKERLATVQEEEAKEDRDSLDKMTDDALKSPQERLIASTATASAVLGSMKKRSKKEEDDGEEQDENPHLKSLIEKPISLLGKLKNEKYEKIPNEIKSVKDMDAFDSLIMRLSKDDLMKFASQQGNTFRGSDKRLSRVEIGARPHQKSVQ